MGNKLVKNIHFYLVGFTLVIALILGAITSLNSSVDCPIHEFRMKLCKPISSEARLYYFKQATRSFKAHPLFGYGPGTFSLITKKFNTTVQRSTIYAHNNFLQIFAESGVFVGVIYTFLIIFLFKNMFFVIENSKNNRNLNKFLLLGLVSLLINSFIDFDWELFPVFQMTVTLIALVLWDFPSEVLKEKNKFNLITEMFIKYVWLSLVIFLITLGVINITTKILVIGNNNSLAFKIFPYFYYQSVYFLTEGGLSETQMNSLYKIYENHDKFILQNIEEETDIDEKIKLYERLIEVKLWEIINNDYYQFLLDSGEHERLGEVSYKGLSLLIENEDNGVGRPYKVKKETIDYLLLSANRYGKKGEYYLYNKYYDLIQFVWDRDREKYN